MLIEAKAAFYNEATGAVQPWRDIEVTDTVGEGLIGEGLAVEIAEGGGGGGIPTPKVTATWKLDGILPSEVGFIEFFNLVEESGGEYVGVWVRNPETSEGVVSGLACPSVQTGGDYKLLWIVGAYAFDRNDPSEELTVAYSDCVNCEDDGMGEVVITDQDSPVSFTVTISEA